MRRTLALALVLLLALRLLPGCGSGGEEKGEYELYFAVSSGVGHGPALDTQPLDWPEDRGRPTPEDLLLALLSGPSQEGLRSPFPRGVALLSWEREGETVTVYLSEQYGGLTDMALTLADYCIVLTLSQLEGVEWVEIRSEGHTTSYRSHQLLQAGEAELTEELMEGADSAT